MINKILIATLPLVIFISYTSFIYAQTVLDDYFWGSENGRLIYKIQVVQDEIKNNKEEIAKLTNRINELKNEVKYREAIIQVANCKLEYVKNRQIVGDKCDYHLHNLGK